MVKSGRVFYTSDLHLGHNRVADIRGLGLAHDDLIELRWRTTVKPEDTVWVLGDVAMSGFDYALERIRTWPGTKHLISGNHDPVHPMHRTATKELQKERWTDTFATIQPFARKKLAGLDIMLSHFPYEAYGDGEHRPGSRYNEYRLPDTGGLLLHGHTHGKERLHGNQLHVGLDAWGFDPVSQEVVIQAFKEASA